MLKMISDTIKRLEDAASQGSYIGDSEEDTIDQVLDLIVRAKVFVVAQVPDDLRRHVIREWEGMISGPPAYGTFEYLIGRIFNASLNLQRVTQDETIPAGIALGVIEDLDLVVATIGVLDQEPVPVVDEVVDEEELEAPELVGPPATAQRSPKMGRTDTGWSGNVVSFEVQ